MKKLIPLFAIAFLALALLPFAADAAGLIPCGTQDNPATTENEATPPCDLCHGFKLIDNIIKFFLWPVSFNNGLALVPIAAAILIVVGGFYLLIAGGDPNNLKKARDILTAVVIGIVIIYGSYLLMNTFFMAIGVNEWVGFKDGAWTVTCQGEPIFPAPPLTK